MSINRKNPAIKRIMADIREMELHPSYRYCANPLEDNMFEWHFTIRGPKDSSFENGLYHGRILLPPEYPFKPPNIIFMTKNGRFEVGAKICLSISAHHPEAWQPAWGIRTILEAIISFLPTEGQGAIGALDWTDEERKYLAKESHSYKCHLCGSAEEFSSRMCKDVDEGSTDVAIVEQIASLHMHTSSRSVSAPPTPSSQVVPSPSDNSVVNDNIHDNDNNDNGHGTISTQSNYNYDINSSSSSSSNGGGGTFGNTVRNDTRNNEFDPADIPASRMLRRRPTTSYIRAAYENLDIPVFKEDDEWFDRALVMIIYVIGIILTLFLLAKIVRQLG